MKMKEYLLTIKIPFKSCDVIEARQGAFKLLGELGLDNVEKEIKLQEIFGDEAPEGINIS